MQGHQIALQDMLNSERYWPHFKKSFINAATLNFFLILLFYRLSLDKSKATFSVKNVICSQSDNDM